MKTKFSATYVDVEYRKCTHLLSIPCLDSVVDIVTSSLLWHSEEAKSKAKAVKCRQDGAAADVGLTKHWLGAI